MSKTFKEFLTEQFKPFVYKNFEVSEAKSWAPDKFISHHANVRSKERFPEFSTATWQGLIKYAIIKFGDDFIKAKDPNSPPGTVGYRSFALSFNHNGFAGWLTLRVRRHPEGREPRRYNLMAITVLGLDQPPLAKHNDIIKKLPPTKTPQKAMAMAEEVIVEAEYQGKTVELDKPFRNSDGDSKFSVYVKNDKGNVVKVNFGDANMEIKRDDPDRRKSYRARHGCDDPGPKWKANYWSCKMWSEKPVSSVLKEKLVVPNEGKSRNKRRYVMPQIESKHIKNFFSWAKEKYNLKTDLKKVNPKDYAATQRDYNEDKVTALADSGKWRDKPILVSGDGFIVDGHHRWLAAAQLGEQIKAYILKAPVDEVLTIMKNYPKTFTKNLNENYTYESLISDLMSEKDEDEDPCWKDYEMVGTKKKDGKDVPNCVPKNEAKAPNPIAKGMIQGKTGAGAHKKKKGKGSYDRKTDKAVDKNEI